MIGIRHMRDAFARRRLHSRVADLADLALNHLRTVYPRELVFETGDEIPVLVLAPHADDETFGAGGTIARHVAAGHRVTVVLFADNAASLEATSTFRADEIIALRRREFDAAMNALGVHEICCLELPGHALDSVDAVSRLRDIGIEKHPRLLYLPSIFDNHDEHRRVNICAARAFDVPRLASCEARGYEVWSPLPATAVCDISDTLTIKRSAIHCYKSQTSVIDYEHHITGLNAYRAITLGGGVRYAEAFLSLPLPQYVRYVTQLLKP
ncbi:MAG: PIG-L family deacetylase [Ignavibacteriae bacterium]|nr:PIG-L family deacetylase [Ignavibacteriota bacterium]